MQPDTTPAGTQRGTILFAHGSRDPLWRKPIEAVADHIRKIAPDVLVNCAYLELSVPDLPTSAAELAARGVNAITVVPLFLGVGKHAREDLPVIMAQLKINHPHISFNLRPAMGEEPLLIELMAKIAIS
ncbi:MAG: CbiX/SirB N-terminal domain-containing protein [Rhodoferax sp.]|jgi:sirohydrochlorin cobaltochelatase|nr:CbiX/SirB N-terminal domain-containing protein [Rhodoferax sp.]MBP9684005.1 CbiX/SirB N-terminal domain-containing protein [Rhodoferax sp.]